MSKSLSILITTIAIAAGHSATASAQSPALETPGFEFVVPTGTVIPTGVQSDSLSRANLMAIQASYGLRPNLMLTATLGWARMRLTGVDSEARLDMFTYDVGLECRTPRRATDKRLNFKPFTALGAGARTHSYRHVDVATTNGVAVYVGAGAEIGVGRVRVRLEARDYITWTNPFQASDSRRGNDVAVLAGLRLAFR